MAAKEDALERLYRLLPWILLVIGLALRIVAFMVNRSLWCDEAMLAHNVLDRSFLGLFQPLDFSQAAPTGFVASVKMMTLVFGDSEYALRLLSLLAGAASLPLFFLLAKRLGNPIAVIMVTGMFALNGRCIFHAGELKPYSVDLAVALLMMVLILKWDESKFSRPVSVAVAAGAALSIWFSFPSVFVVSAGLTCLLIRELVRRQWWKVGALAGVGAVWLSSVGANYWFVLRTTVGNDYLQKYWAKNMLPYSSISDMVFWTGDALVNTISEPLGFTCLGLGLVLFFIGVILLLKDHKFLGMMLLTPIFATFLGSALHLYPLGGFGGRTILFLIPMFLLPMAAALGWISDHLPQGVGRVVGTGLILVILFFHPLTSIRTTILTPPDSTEEIRPVLRYVQQNARIGDTVYFYWKTRFAMAYYHRKFDFRHVKVIKGNALRKADRDGPQFISQLDALIPAGRVWLIFSNWGRPSEPGAQMVTEYLSRFGQQTDMIRKPGASAYLFTFQEAGIDDYQK